MTRSVGKKDYWTAFSSVYEVPGNFVIPVWGDFQLWMNDTDTFWAVCQRDRSSNTTGRTILSWGDGGGRGRVSLVHMRLLHSFCGRNKKTCIALQANKCTASWLKKISCKAFRHGKKNSEKIARPHSLFMRCFDHVRIKSRNSSTLNGFGAVNCCMDPALPLQIKLTVVSPLLLFLATITLIL